MKLHQNKEAFEQTIEATSKYFKIFEVFVEKDYWVTYVLKNLSQSKHKDRVVFKGGTSLSKAHRIINRFSEDIDLAIVGADEFSGNAIKKLIKEVEEHTTKGLTEIVIDEVTSKGSKFRKTVFEYPRIIDSNNFGQAKDKLLIEINSFANPHPYSEMPIQSIIADFLVQTDKKNVVDDNELNAFNVNVLGLERTFTEKVLSLVRASYAKNPMEELSDRVRHIYDLHFIVNKPSMKEFITGNGFQKTIKDVLADDEKNSQFQGDWTKQSLGVALIFADWENVWKELQDVYQNQFRSLTFAELPENSAINKSMNIIIKAIG
ncbi:MAG: nucleotidyl transferase AbiEii/AbiGii toxin family protein [Bacteroidota bacterium]